MGVYYETVRKFTHIRLKEIPQQADKKGFLEFEATRFVLGLSGIVMAVVLRANINRTVGLGYRIDLSQYTVDGKRQAKRKDIISRIDNIRKIIPNFIPKEEKENLGIKSKELSLLGLVSLGILAVVYPDVIGEASIRFQALTYILKQDRLAALLYSTYPNTFNGYKTIDDLLDLSNEIDLPTSKLKEIYLKANLPNSR